MPRLRVSRRVLFPILLIVAVGLIPGAARAASRPNILLITADDLGPQLGCYGDERARTPNLDRLAAEGVRFEFAYVTQASCSPSRSSIFTGLYPHQNGQIGLSHHGYSMRPGMQTLPAILKRAGYRTGVIGKVHVAPGSALPFDFKHTNVRKTRDVGGVAEAARVFIDRSANEPFFLMVNYMDPHRPLTHQVKGVPAEPFGPDDVVPFPFLGIDTPKVRTEVAGYYNCTTRVDVGVGLLLDALAKTGRAKETFVIFIGDHGPPFTRGKTTCYEAGLRIPFLVRWPGHAAGGQVRKELVSTVDILPTVMDAAGLSALPDLAGASLTKLLAEQKIAWRETLCAEYTAHLPASYFPRRSIRDSRYKLILNLVPDRPNPIKGVDGCAGWAASRESQFNATSARKAFDTYHRPPAVELYDLQKDPVEFKNLAGKTELRETQERLRRQLRAWREETNDPLLDPKELAASTRWHDEKNANDRRKRKERGKH